MKNLSTKHMFVLVVAVTCVALLVITRMNKNEAAAPAVMPATQMSAASKPAEIQQELREIGSRTELEALLAQTDKPVVVKFFATWCPPCRALKPTYSAGAQELANEAYFAEIDIDAFKDKGYLDTFDVQTIPTIILFKQGKEVKRLQGLKNKSQLKEELASL